LEWYHHHPKGPEKSHHDYCNLAIVTSLPPYIKGPKKRHYYNFEIVVATPQVSQASFNSIQWASIYICTLTNKTSLLQMIMMLLYTLANV